jgi:RHS repeat-associated protein
LRQERGLRYGRILDKLEFRYEESLGGLKEAFGSVKLGIKLTSYDKNGNILSILPQDKELVLEGGNIDQTEIHFEDVYRYDYEITYILRDGISLPRLTDNFVLEASARTELYYEDVVVSKGVQVNSSIDASTGDIVLNWTGVSEEFEVEWQYVMGYQDGSYVYPSKPSSLNRFDFERVLVKGNEFRIPNYYDNGYVYYRVRGISRQASNNLIRKENPWNDSDDQRIQIKSRNTFVSRQYTGTFGDQGTISRTLTYVDATTKVRQEQVLNSSLGVSLVSENYYDYEGRPVITTLPSPDNSLSGNMDYKPDFNKAIKPSFYGQNRTHLLTKDMYDLSYRTTCSGVMAPEFSTTTGAGKYYSNQNDFKTNQGEYVAQGEGYPYSQIVYDQNGRSSKQAGAGGSHRLGSGHEVVLYYVQPKQKQLDRLFGNEVGKLDKYSMKVVRDQNGQLSCKYEDMTGRTIATSMLGESPSMLDSLEEDKNRGIISDNFNNLNHYEPSQQGYVIETDLFVEKPDTKYRFYYGLDRGVYTSLCSTGNYDCVYDLEITITDECSQNLANDNLIGNYYTTDSSKQVVFNKIITITGSHYQSDTLDVYFPKMGSYHVRKVLRLNEQALLNAKASFLTRMTCVTSESDRLTEYEGNTDRSGCSDCSTTGHSGDYCDVPTSGTGSSNSGGSGEGSDNCSSIYSELLSDVSPGGQYFDGQDDHTPPDEESTTASAWFLAHPYSFTKSDGTVCNTWNLIKDNWDDSWAETMVVSHPEYALYQQVCSSLVKDSKDYLSGLKTMVMSKGVTSSELSKVLNGDFRKDDPYYKGSTSSIQDGITTYLSVGNVTINGDNSSLEAECSTVATNMLSTQSMAVSHDALTASLMLESYQQHIMQVLKEHFPSGCHYLQDDFPMDGVSDESGLSKGYDIVIEDETRMQDYLQKIQSPTGSAFITQLANQAGVGNVNLVRNGDFEDVVNYDYSDISHLGFETDYQYRNYDDIALGLNSILPSNYQPESDKTRIQAGEASVFRNDFKNNKFSINNYNIHYRCYYGTANFSAGAGYAHIYDHTYGSKARITNNYVNEIEPANPTGGYYLITDGHSQKNKMLWKQTINVVPNKIYDFSFWGIQITSVLIKNYVDHKPLLGGIIRDLQGNVLYRTPIVELDGKIKWKTPDGVITDSPWTPIAGRWTNTTNLTQVEICIYDYYVDNNNHTDGDNFAIDDISFIPENDTTERYIPFDCVCTGINNASGYYSSIWSMDTTTTAFKTLFIDTLYRTVNTNLQQSNGTTTEYATKLELSTAYAGCLQNNVPGITFTHQELNDLFCSDIQVLDCGSDADIANDFNASDSYNNAVTKALVEFEQEYRSRCFQTKENQGELEENFTYQTDELQYHYTLYYYDQSGNLTRTVPPSGVHVLGESALASVENYRKQLPNSSFTVPAHSLVTLYEYDSYNQLVRKYQPDSDGDTTITPQSPQGYTHYYYYDNLGRMRAWQDARQIQNKQYSYVRYDVLGRVVESGELSSTDTDISTKASGLTFPDNLTNQSYKHEVSRTYYDVLPSEAAGYFTSSESKNLRLRVSATSYDSDGDGSIETGSYYSYSEHGDVNVYLNYRKDLAPYHLNNGLFRTEYSYDLLTGKVQSLRFNPGKSDQLTHRYEYDKDHRLTNVYTSRNGGVSWNQDAKYYYYLLGSLARKELGDLQVQGQDYLYTIQGWQKGLNSSILKASNDIGQDGYQGTDNQSPLHRSTSQDVMGYVLGYYKDDYIAVSTNVNTFLDPTTRQPIISKDILGVDYVTDLEGKAESEMSLGNIRSLYNGNIGYTSLGYSKQSNSGVLTQNALHLTAYRYDQLQRFKQSRIYSTTTDYSHSVSTLAYGMNMVYDAMGNITSLKRRDDQGLMMDDLSYRYDYNPTTNTLKSNRLYHVNDAVLTTMGSDITDQGTFTAGQLTGSNYGYDVNGSLVSDKQSGIALIEWTSTGKVKEILRNSSPSTLYSNMEFNYDELGRRIEKIEKPYYLTPAGRKELLPASEWIHTYYVQDAQGNPLATYVKKLNENKEPVFELMEHYIYGSTRLGSIVSHQQVSSACVSGAYENAKSTISYVGDDEPTSISIKIGGIEITDGGISRDQPPAPFPTNPSLAYTIWSAQDVVNSINAKKSYPEYSAELDRVNPNQIIIYRQTKGVEKGLLEMSVGLGTIGLVEDFTGGEVLVCSSSRQLGSTYYELTDHLGDVVNVITDRKRSISDTITPTKVLYFTADVVSYASYYPFGMTMPGRHGYTGTKYRYGFQNQEMDDEIAGGDNVASYKYRLDDVRIGRFWSVDPMAHKREWLSPYNFVQNNPIIRVDPNGALDDWFKRGGSDTWEYDSRVQSEAQAKEAYGQNTQYKNDGGTFQGREKSTGKSVGTVTLHTGGLMTWNVKGKAYGAYAEDKKQVSELARPRVEAEAELQAEKLRIASRLKTIDELEEFTANMFFAVGTGGVGLEFQTAKLLMAGVNASGNLGAQLLANNGDWSKVDVLGVGISFGSAYLPGGSTTNIVKSSVFSAGLDASFDYSASSKFDYIGKKNWSVVGNDMFWGLNGNLQGGLIPQGLGRKFELGTSVLTNPTNVYMNTLINNTITNTNPK